MHVQHIRTGGADRGGGGDRLVVRGEGIQHLVMHAAIDQGEGEPVAGQPVGVRAGDPLDQPVAAQPGQVVRAWLMV
jgi:hypothetical protein